MAVLQDENPTEALHMILRGVPDRLRSEVPWAG